MIPRLVLLLILLVLRLYNLELRPPHHDEAVNGWFVDGIFNRGYYQYDPANYHGPLFFYILSLFRLIFGRSLFALRLPVVLFSWLVNFTPLLFKRWIGSKAAWIAIFFLAVSPAMVFYSRYTIHEMCFALSCILFFYYWMRARTESFTTANTLGLGFSLGAMATLKENFVLYIACLLIGEVVMIAYERLFPKYTALPTSERELKFFENPKRSSLGILSVIGIGFACVLLLFSAAGRDQNGFMNFFKAFGLWSQTGSNGNGHQKPFLYWIDLMTTLEWFAFLGLLMVPLALRKTTSFIRYLSVITFGLFMAYSIVNYKTPWCVLSFYWGFILVAAYWFSEWMKSNTWRAPIYVLLVVGFSVSAYQSYICAFDEVDADHHLYIYGQTFRDLMVPLNEIVELGKEHPELHQKMRIQVLSTFTWPLPYVLGEFKQTGFYGENNLPPHLDGDYIIMDSALEPKYANRITLGNYTRKEYRSRQWASPMAFYKKNP
jgi:uncharacterized protein (TIGR03663 family)